MNNYINENQAPVRLDSSILNIRPSVIYEMRRPLEGGDYLLLKVRDSDESPIVLRMLHVGSISIQLMKDLKILGGGGGTAITLEEDTLY